MVALDIDAPFPSWAGLGPIQHWIQSGLRVEQDSSDTKNLKATNVPFIADYIGPAPPPGSAPHRYVFFLYNEPADFDVKKHAPPEGKHVGNFKRMWYKLETFEREANLGPIIAANYFVSN